MKGRVHALLVILAIAGLALFVILLIRTGLPQVLSAIAAMKWALLLVVASHVVPLLADVLGWRPLFPGPHRPTFQRLLWIRWIGESLNALLPAAQVGGDIVRARLLAARGVPGPLASATVLGDMTFSVLAQVVFTVVGVGVLARLSREHVGMVGPAIIGTLLALAAVAGFFAVQRFGAFRLVSYLASRAAHSPTWLAFARSAEALDTELRTMYARRAALAVCCFWNIASLFLGAGETYLALWALGLPVSVGDAIALEAAGQGIRAALFVIPGGIGVQEGGYMLVGGMLGIRPEGAMAVSLARRARELCFGVPALIAWPFLAGARARRQAAEAPAGGTAVTAAD